LDRQQGAAGGFLFILVLFFIFNFLFCLSFFASSTFESAARCGAGGFFFFSVGSEVPSSWN
jgi:hypothetical protein